ncbi:hypothetical protein RB614_42180 [Phytohabitans sp. ZYX-F-186]|uniref:EthD domain-containing protein n=1 Tax=Phytohabitans maris TaxID=3071409 RepID=A0ABU0ZVR5_9ACTN|nr:hypothetical protein [Phytohabitans sp. ZYX-F-186]MDQ7911118.1 hypothetical protein [Phytohabitans sp. ZYX-F-186]
MSRRFIVTRFRLSEGDTIGEYRAWSLSYLRPVLRGYPSVVSFLDFAVVGAEPEGGERWDGCEIIEVTDFAAFAEDDATGEGAKLSAAWRDRVAGWSIDRLEDLAEFEDSAGP